VEESVARGSDLSGKGERGLATYRRKRDADRTPEPFGARAPRPGLYTVQLHDARRRHHDLRLEWGGALLSWAVPKGPSLDPAEKRLAVQVEDHPLDYADFEGVIPEGNYGAGAVILWDRGRWIPLEDPEEGLARGKLLFDLEGYKLRGRFTLVRTGGRRKPAGREWLLIKKADAYAQPGGEDPAEESVLSGLTLDELRGGSERARRVTRALARSKAPQRRVTARSVKPMLADPMGAPFSRKGWLFEAKHDGYRMIGAREDGEGLLFTRNGTPAARRFPEVARALEALPYDHIVLDGEIVAADGEGRPSFQRLQQRALLQRPRDIERATVENPVTFFVFDLLAFGDRDLRPLPLVRRKALLEELLPRYGPLRFTPHFVERGEAVFAQVAELGLEGMMAKRADAPYKAGRWPEWKKLRILATADFVIVGYTAPRGSRTGFGALHLAWYVAGELRYAGRVGSGFSEDELTALRADLDALRRDTPAFAGAAAAARSRDDRWVEPRLVCEVRYAEVTGEGLLRQPSFVRLRDDKAPAECVGEAPPSSGSAVVSDDAESGAEAAVAEGARVVPFTNLDKVFWPAEGYTKGDLVEYHRAIAPWLLPYLRDRPLVMTRYPDGIDGKSFFQKDAPTWVPDWVRRETMWSEHAQREVHYFVCDDLESLLYVVNLGTIPLHVWSSRVADLAHPDWTILDLDPKGAPFADVVEVARRVRDLCGELELPCFPKTSGSSGLHVLVPLGGQLTYEQSRSLAELLARVVVQRLPEIATIARRLKSREGKVYVDYLQNGHGRLLVAPFSVRPLPGAPVSMPLRWREVGSRLDNARYTLRNAPARMRRLGEDPLAGVFGEAPDLPRALALLAERLGG
jgi:bifunctional non-homologous end joining protein LigD